MHCVSTENKHIKIKTKNNLEVKKKALPLQSKTSRSGAVVARWAHNPKVVRSNRTSATQKKLS